MPPKVTGMSAPQLLTSDPDTGLTVENDVDGSRYRIRHGADYIGLIDYTVSADGMVLSITHTEVLPGRQGGGVAGVMAGRPSTTSVHAGSTSIRCALTSPPISVVILTTPTCWQAEPSVAPPGAHGPLPSRPPS